MDFILVFVYDSVRSQSNILVFSKNIKKNLKLYTYTLLDSLQLIETQANTIVLSGVLFRSQVKTGILISTSVVFDLYSTMVFFFSLVFIRFLECGFFYYYYIPPGYLKENNSFKVLLPAPVFEFSYTSLISLSA